MREKETLQLSIQNAKANIKANKKTISDRNEEIKSLQNAIREYIASNTTATVRAKLQKKKSNLLKLAGGVAGLAVVTVLVDVIWKLVKGVHMSQVLWVLLLVLAGIILGGAIALVVYALTFNKPIRALSEDLSTFDVYKNELEDKIAACQKAIAGCNKAIRQETEAMEECEDELEYYKYENLFQNHVMVFAGEKNSLTGKYKNVVNTIEIDGAPVGFAERPFKAIRLEPGIHQVKLSVQHEANGTQTIVHSDPVQVSGDGDSVYLLFEFKNPQDGITVTEFTEIVPFFDATKQSP